MTRTPNIPSPPAYCGSPAAWIWGYEHFLAGHLQPCDILLSGATERLWQPWVDGWMSAYDDMYAHLPADSAVVDFSRKQRSLMWMRVSLAYESLYRRPPYFEVTL